MAAIAEIRGDTGIPLFEGGMGDLLIEAAARSPDRIAAKQYQVAHGLVDQISYAELLESAQRLGHQIAERFDRGERIALWGTNGTGWLAYEFAIAMAGAVTVTLDPALGELELRYMLETSGATGIIIGGDYRGRNLRDLFDKASAGLPIRDILRIDDWRTAAAASGGKLTTPRAQADDPALIVFTSGTTGKPKGVILHHRGAVNNARFATITIGIAEGSVMLNPLPSYSVGSAVSVNVGAISRSHTQIIVDYFDTGTALRLVGEERLAWMPLVPAVLMPMVEHPAFADSDLSSLETVWLGGTTITPDHVRLARDALGVEVQSIYGQTEACGIHSMTRRGEADDVISYTVGKPLNHGLIRIVDPAAGSPCAIGAVGEIRERSPVMTHSYFGDPAATAELFDSDGFMRTGDLGFIDADGNLRITGRLKDVIIRGGRNIYPREIEDLICTFPGIAEVAVIGVPHARWGEEVAAAIKPAAGGTVDPAALQAFLADRIAAYKVPKAWRLVDDFPRSGQGKIRKADLAPLFRETA